MHPDRIKGGGPDALTTAAPTCDAHGRPGELRQEGQAGMSKSKALLEVRNVTHFYSGFAALKNVDFELAAGSIHALVGENGAGKSTLVKVIAGIIQPTDGDILLEGNKVRITPVTRRELGISIVPQHVEFFPYLSLAENIFMDSLPKRGPFVDYKKLRATTAQWFDRFGLPFSPDTMLHELSFVQQKVLAILKALKDDGKIIILDEPTASLHVGEIRQMFGFIREFNARGVSFIYISHHLQEVFDICDTVSVLRDGAMQGRFAVADLDLKKLVAAMVGAEVEQTRAGERRPRTCEPVLAVRRLSGKDIVRDIDFTLNKGEVLGIVSNRGSGKDELVGALFGIAKAKDGSIGVMGKHAVLSSSWRAMERQIMLLPEDRHKQGLFLGKTITENITAANLDAVVNRARMINRKQENAVSLRYIGDLSIACTGPAQNVRFLSGGNQQKVVVGKVLHTLPKIILLDSPTVGVDVKARAEIHRLILGLSESGISIVVFSSDIEEITAICDRVLVLSRGRLTNEIFPGDDHFNVRSLGVLIEGGTL
jgi:ABC-type sugar transport system ATPase subunit